MANDGVSSREWRIKRRQTELVYRFRQWLSDGAWRERAKCRGKDVNRYFPEGIKFSDSYVKDIAARDCAPCPVRNQCLADALATQGTSGIHSGVLFPAGLLRFDADKFEQTLIWNTYLPNIAATSRLEQRRAVLG